MTSRAFEGAVPPPERPSRSGEDLLHGRDDFEPPSYEPDRSLPADPDESVLDLTDGDRFDEDRFDGDQFDPDQFDPDQFDPDRFDADYPVPDGEYDADQPARGVASLRYRLESPRARARVQARGERRTAWAYLGLLTGMFGFLVVFGYACSDLRPDDVAATDSASELVGGATPSRLVFRIDGDVVAVQGAVPDEPARDQLISVAQGVYAPENVVNNVSVDDGTTLESGTVRFVGSALLGDERPEALRQAVASTFGLDDRGFEVGFSETVRSPVEVEASISEVAGAGASVVLVGALPDEQSVADLQTVAAEVWGPDNVDGAGLVVGEATWTDGVIRLTGSTLPTDDRPAQFGALVNERIDALVTVDTSGLSIVDNSAQVAAVQVAVDELVTASPIQFGPDSPVISEESDAVLADLATAFNQVPDVPFDVVGHTDDVGNDQDNLLLSEARAEAVVQRLTELGVDASRMTARGEGEASPIADNATEEGKAANRRIEFILVGTSSG